MEEAHTILHQISALLGIKQCTSTQILGICLEFWVGGAVSVGFLKVKDLLSIKKKFETMVKETESKPKSKKKPKKKKRKKR